MKKTFFLGLCSMALFACSNQSPDAEKTETTVAAAEVATTPQPAEIGDPKYMDIGKKGLASLSSGDVDGWMNSFADNVVWQWNNGDSLVGKPAVSGYWKNRRSEAIDSITFINQIFLPLQVNQPQSIEQPGLWLLSWYSVNAKYKNGKRMSQAIHTAMHFNSADKIDRVVQYLDRVPINAAMAKK
jgi:ketosteroid isomerase-like protein